MSSPQQARFCARFRIANPFFVYYTRILPGIKSKFYGFSITFFLFFQRNRPVRPIPGWSRPNPGKKPRFGKACEKALGRLWGAHPQAAQGLLFGLFLNRRLLLRFFFRIRLLLWPGILRLPVFFLFFFFLPFFLFHRRILLIAEKPAYCNA